MNYRRIAEKRRAIKSNMMVVGVDVAKFKHVARALLPDHTFTNPCYFTNDIHGFNRFLAKTSEWRRKYGFTEIIVGMEPTGHYFKPLARWLIRQDVQVVLVMPRDVSHRKADFNNNPTKCDPKDAILIADLVAGGCYFPARLAQGNLAVLQRLVHYRWQLVKDRTRMLNRLQADLDERFPEFAAVYRDVTTRTAQYLIEHYSSPGTLASRTVAQLSREIKQHCAHTVDETRLTALLSKAAETIGSEDGWNGLSTFVIPGKLKTLKLLKEQLEEVEAAIGRLVWTFADTHYMTSVGGIGPLSAAVYIAETGGLGNYAAGDAVVKMAGLDLCEQSTGETHGQRHISHYGRSLLRTTAYFDALVQSRRGMPLHDLYEQLVKRGKPKVEALVAVGCALLRLLHALVRDQRTYTPKPPARSVQPAA